MSNITNLVRSTLNVFQVLWTNKSLSIPTISIAPYELSLKVAPQKMQRIFKDYSGYMTNKIAKSTQINLMDLIKLDCTNSKQHYDIQDMFTASYHLGARLVLRDHDEALKCVKVSATNLVGNGSIFRSNKIFTTNDHLIKAAGSMTWMDSTNLLSNTPKLINHVLEDHNSWLPAARIHANNQIKKFEWDNWLPVKLVKPAIFNYLSNKAMKFIDIYSNSKDISEAGGKFVQSLGTVDESGIVIPKIQHKLLDLTKSYILDSQLLGKAIVEATDILFSPIKPVDSLAYTACTVVTSLIGEGTNTHPNDVVVLKLV